LGFGSRGPEPAQNRPSGYTIFVLRALRLGHAGIHLAAQDQEREFNSFIPVDACTVLTTF
jgi:hypothetical protein